MKRTKNESLIKEEKQRIERTKEKIIDTIQKLKEKKKKISVTMIAKESGISRTTLYKYTELIVSHTNIKIETKEKESNQKDKIKSLKESNNKLKDKNNTLIKENDNLKKQLLTMKLYIDELEIKS